VKVNGVLNTPVLFLFDQFGFRKLLLERILDVVPNPFYSFLLNSMEELVVV